VDCIFATVGPTGTLFDALRREASPSGVPTVIPTAQSITPGGTSVGVSDPNSPATRWSNDATQTIAAFGSGLRNRGMSPAADAVLLMAGPDHTRGVNALVAVATPGDHRLFTFTTPGGGTVVCSQLGVLARAVGAELSIDRSYEDMLLGHGFLPDGRTVYSGISALPPGSRSVITADGITTAPITTGPSAIPSTSSHGGDPDELPTPAPSFDDAVDQLHGRFMAALVEQAGDDRRHAVLLGGLDSALVAASLVAMGHEVHTYTFGFGDPTYEQRNVPAFTTAAGTMHHTVPITPTAVMDGLERLADVFSQPGSQPHYQIHTLIASRQIAADGFTHVFTGDGADAVFLGYPTVSQRARLVQRLGRVPAPVARAGSAALRTRFADRHLGHVGRTARASLDNLTMDAPARGHLPTRLLDDHALARLRLGPAPAQAESVAAIRTRLAAGLGDHDAVRLAFHGHGLTGQSRVKVDGAVAATGVTQSTPFKHPLVRDWVASLPVDFLRTPGAPSAGAGKELLVAMVKRYNMVPDAIVNQPKQSPSDSPIDTWYAGELRPRILSLLDDLPFAWDRTYVEEILSPKRAEELFRQKVSISHHAFQVIGLLASYASFAGVAARSGARR
jgi:hypothetical protein